MAGLDSLIDLAAVRPPLDDVFSDALKSAMAVHSVHVDQSRSLSVAVDSELLYPGMYSIDAAGEPVRIAVNPAVARPALTFLHEVGHYLDHAVIGDRSRWASNGEMLTPWREAIASTDAVRQLEQQQSAPPLPQLARGMGYLLRTEELFARSYSQWIAMRSGNQGLLDELGSSLSGLSYPEYWGMDDFAPVADAFHQVFTELNWIP